MKKVIAAFDGLKYSKSTRDYAIQVAQQNGVHLVGVFLDDAMYTSYKIYELIPRQGGVNGALKKKWDKKDIKTRAAAVKDFETACRKAGVPCTIHRDRRTAIRELLHESIYADLIVIDARETLTHHSEKVPTGFLRDLLSQMQCPVLVVPPVFKPVKKLVLLYDGEPSSVHAIKMLSYTLPEFKEYITEIIWVNSKTNSKHLPDNRLMKEFTRRHFPNASITVLKGDAETEIVNFLKQQKDIPLVALGAYRRGMVSRWFRESMADVLMKEIKLPLFIAHNK